jgi:sarcosine oxidase subunit beta
MNSAKHMADVAIIGGGLMGVASAFFLRKRGLSVVLVERSLIGQQASGVNYGNVRRQGRYLGQLPLAHRSRLLWGRLPELIGHDAEFLPTGHLRASYEVATMERLEKYATDAKPWGLDLTVLSQTQLRKRFPYLSAEVIGGSFSPDDGHANPRLAAPLFGRAARSLGATILENSEVLDVQKVGSEFHLACGDGTSVVAPIALVCTGAWAGKISSSFGERVPMEAQGPVMGVTEPVPYGIAPLVGVTTANQAEEVYFRQVKRGNIVFGGGVRCAAYLDERRARPTASLTVAQLARVRRLAPALKNLYVLRTWSGVEGYIADKLPVMGESSRIPGLYYAFGFCGHGFQLGPGVGDVMAELISQGSTTTPIEPFGIGRFAQQERTSKINAISARDISANQEIDQGPPGE